MTDYKKLLTVSVAAYNVENTLGNAVESCMVSDSSAIEVIIVNDGSTDDTLAVANALHDRYPDVVRVIDKSNGGYGSTINRSIQEARGKYYRYLDGDDWFDKDAFERYIEVLSGRNEDMIVTPYLQVYEDGTDSVLRDPFPNLQEGPYRFQDLPADNLAIACSIAYRTEKLRKSGFMMSEGCYYADTEYANLPLSCMRSIYISHSPIYQYRLGYAGQSVSSDSIERHYNDLLRVRERIFAALHDSEGCPAYTYLQRSAAREVRIAYDFILRARPNEARLNALRRLDQMASSYPTAYRLAGKESRKIAFLRFTHHACWSYRLCCAYTRRKSDGRPF